MTNEQEFLVPINYQEKERLDQYLCPRIGEISRSHLKTRLESVTVNGVDAKLSRHIQGGDVIRITLNPEIVQDLIPEKIDFQIIYENDDVMVINKPRNLVVHPAPGHASGTLLNGILSHLDEEFLADQEGSIRPGIVHRLDKDTSGLMIVAKTASAMTFLSEQFSSRTTYKEYQAIVCGRIIGSSGTIDKNLIRDPSHRQKYKVCEGRGKHAVTDYFVQKRWEQFSLVRLVIHTGRTHQIRVHMKSLGHPVAGDPIYGKINSTFPDLQLMLHSSILKIVIPGESKPRTFSAEMPEDMTVFMKALEESQKS